MNYPTQDSKGKRTPSSTSQLSEHADPLRRPPPKKDDPQYFQPFPAPDIAKNKLLGYCGSVVPAFQAKMPTGAPFGGAHGVWPRGQAPGKTHKNARGRESTVSALWPTSRRTMSLRTRSRSSGISDGNFVDAIIHASHCRACWGEANLSSRCLFLFGGLLAWTSGVHPVGTRIGERPWKDVVMRRVRLWRMPMGPTMGEIIMGASYGGRRWTISGLHCCSRTSALEFGGGSGGSDCGGVSHGEGKAMWLCSALDGASKSCIQDIPSFPASNSVSSSTLLLAARV
jgi:hypothetical protein